MSPATHYGPPMSREPQFWESSMTTTKNDTDSSLQAAKNNTGSSLQAILDAPDSERSQHIDYDVLRALMDEESPPESPPAADRTDSESPPTPNRRPATSKRPHSPDPLPSASAPQSPPASPTRQSIPRTEQPTAPAGRRFGTSIDPNTFNFSTPLPNSMPRPSTPPPPARTTQEEIVQVDDQDLRCTGSSKKQKILGALVS